MNSEVRSVRAAEEICHRDEQGCKQCSRCAGWFPDAEFGRNAKAPDGLLTFCNHCKRKQNRQQRLRSHYALTPNDVTRMLAEQSQQCAICGGAINLSTCQVDHDHSCCQGRETCGKCVRALLCNMCNPGLGAFKDSPELLLKAADYLRIWSARDAVA